MLALMLHTQLNISSRKMTKEKHYPEPNQNLDFAALEKDILKFWKENKVFEKSVEIRNFDKDLDDDNVSPVLSPCALKDHAGCRHEKEERAEFVFYDGPPFANGLPHYGHLLTGFIKDIFARYQTMKGKKVERKFGWDTHGLPVEMETEKELTALEGKPVSGQIAIQEYGIEKFNDACRNSVMKYAGDWKNYVEKQGRWVDFENGYKTMDVNYMESVIWAFKQLHEKGFLYEDFRVVPYSWACQTPLSNFETRMDNSYRRKESKAVTVKFELENIPEFLKEFNPKSVSLVAWTTTPWTLPSNLGLAVGKDIEYVAIKQSEEIFIISESCAPKYFNFPPYKPGFIPGSIFESGEIVKKFIGKEILGLKYLPLFPYFTNNEKTQNSSKTFTVLQGDFVTTEEGTGIVHLAPGFGEDDQLLCKANGIPTLCPVDEGGKFTTEIFDLENLSLKGRQVFETNEDIIKYLKATDTWLKTEQYLHNYPHCWRTDTPLIYKAVSSWYVKVTDFKDRMVELNQQINWIPDHIKDGQFGKWLEGARDWSISRNRFWGCPVPIWKSTNPSFIKEFSNFESLKKFLRDNEKHLKYSKDSGPVGNSFFIQVKNNSSSKPISFYSRSEKNAVKACVDIGYPKEVIIQSFNNFLEPNEYWTSEKVINRINARNFQITDDTKFDLAGFHLYTFGSISEIEEFFDKPVKNLHRPYIDDLKLIHPLDPESRIERVTDVLDCWFESGSMPYAQVHYPFENKEWFENNFPADFITEYVAQTRGWFYTLMVLSTAIFDRAPFKNVICHGTILDEKSQKLSKRLKNYADPLEVFSSLGSDAMRFYMISQPVMRGQELRIDKDGKAIRDTLRLSIKPLINAFNFFCLYANSDGIKAERVDFGREFKNILDRYILAKLKTTVLKIDEAMKNYDTVIACEEFNQFFEVLNNWYIRRNRPRFWKSAKENNFDQDKQDAYDVLFTALVMMCEASAPLLPFTSEFVWRSLVEVK